MRDQAYRDWVQERLSRPRPPWLPASHILPPDELALLTTAEAAGLGNEALEIVVYHLIQTASNARRERIQRDRAEEMRHWLEHWETFTFEPGLSRRQVGPCGVCGRLATTPGRVLCKACRRVVETRS